MSRAAFVGACFGALHGEAAAETDGSQGGVPLPWLSLLHDGSSILLAARKLIDARKDLLQGASDISMDDAMGA